MTARQVRLRRNGRRRLDLSLKMNQIDTRRELAGQGMAGWSKPRIAERGRVATQRQRRVAILRRCLGARPQPLRRRTAIGE